MANPGGYQTPPHIAERIAKAKAALAALEGRTRQKRPLLPEELAAGTRSFQRGEQEADILRSQLGAGSPTFKRIVAALIERGQVVGPQPGADRPYRSLPERSMGRPEAPPTPVPGIRPREEGKKDISYTPRSPLNARRTDLPELHPIGKALKELPGVTGRAFVKWGDESQEPRLGNVMEERRKEAILEQQIEREKARNAGLVKNTAFEENLGAMPEEEEPIENPLIGESTKEASRQKYRKGMTAKYVKGMPATMAEKVRKFIEANPDLMRSHVSELIKTKDPLRTTLQSSTLGQSDIPYGESDSDKGYDESQAGEIDLASRGTPGSLAGRAGALDATSLLGDEPTAFAGAPLVQRGQEAFSGIKIPPKVPRPEGTIKTALPPTAEFAKQMVGTKGAPVTIAQKMRKFIKANPRLVVYAKGKRDLSKIPSEKVLAERNKPAKIKKRDVPVLTSGSTMPPTEEIKKLTTIREREAKAPYGGGRLTITPPKDTPETEHIRGIVSSPGRTGKGWQAQEEEIAKIREVAKQIQKEKQKEAQSRRAMALNKARRGNG